MTNISANISLNTSWPLNSNADSLIDKIPKALAFCLVFVISIAGNSFIIWTIQKDNRLKTTTNVLVANMAFADIINTIFGNPVRVYEIIYSYEWVVGGELGLALCKIVYFPPSFTSYVAMYSCVFIAIDRYYAVAHPMKGGFSRTRLKYIIPGIWILAFSISFPFLYYMNIFNTAGRITCILRGLSVSSFMYALLIAFVFPVLAVTIIYPIIVYKLRQHKLPGHQTDSVRQRREQQNKKVLKMCAVIVVSLCFTFVFLAILLILLAQGKGSKYMKFFGLFISQLSSCYNFFICLIFNDIYRQNFKYVLSKCCCLNIVEPGIEGVVMRMNNISESAS